MENLMKAICLTPTDGLTLQSIPKPEKAEPGHLLIKMEACGINAGDKAFIGGTFPVGSISVSRYNICGVSGVGTVLEIGAGVPNGYKGKQVTIYRSLKFDENIIGTWCQYAHLPYLQCAIVPDQVNAEDYSGSLVNIITPYAFLKQIIHEGHKGIISTAGTSATGIAMVGICLAYNFPLISIVRTEEAKKELEKLGAEHVLIQADHSFEIQLRELSQKLATTAVFDGVGGEILNAIIDVIPTNSTIYSYGYLGGKIPLTIHTSLLMKGITLKGFSNFRSQTVQNPRNLENALNEITELIHMPHFKTKMGKKFKFDEIQEALLVASENGAKPILYPFE